MTHTEELYWVYEGIVLSVVLVVLTLPAVAALFYEDPAFAIAYVLGLLTTVTTAWFLALWRVLPRTSAAALENELFDDC